MPKRTTDQNNALHLFCQQLADVLNDAGFDQRKVLKPSIDIPWTKDAVKNQLWRPIQNIMFHKESTTELNKVGEIDDIHEVLMRHLCEKFGIEHIPFPHDPDKISNHPVFSPEKIENYPEY